MFLLATDGITEAFNGGTEEFGETRLMQALKETAGKSASEISQHILTRLNEFTRGTPLHDDSTLVVIKTQ